MGDNKEELKVYSKDEIKQYLNIIGYDEEDLKKVRIKACKSLKLEFLHDLYSIIEAEKILPPSSKKLSINYELLMSKINDDFVYPEEEEREKLYNASLEIIKNASLLQVSNDDKDTYTIFERTNNVLNITLQGLIFSDNIIKLNLVLKNLPPKLLLERGREEENENIRKLYGLIALSKFDNVESDDDIFNMFDTIDEEKLYDKVSLLAMRNEPFTKNNYSESQTSKKLSLRRPTLKELKDCGDYIKM